MSGRATPDAILAAAAQAFAAHGYHGMSMRELGRAIGRSPASFYNHFDSKEDLLFSVQYRAFESLLEGAERSLDGVTDARARLYAFILNHVRTFAAQPDVMRVLVHEASALPPDRRAHVRGRKEAYFEIGRRIVSEIAPGEPAEIVRSTYCLFGMLNWMHGWYEPRRHGSPRELARTIFRIALGGLSAKPMAEVETAGIERRLERMRARPLLAKDGAA